MSAYAIGTLRNVNFGDEIRTYLLTIDDTLEPFGGRFLVHGNTPQEMDGSFPGAVVVIEFPDLERAHAWYASPGYQEIADFRVKNAEGGAVIVDGVPAGYRADSFLAKR